MAPADLRMIDFAHTTFYTDEAVPECHTADDGYIFGITSLIQHLNALAVDEPTIPVQEPT